MGVNKGIISTPISISDISSAMGAATTDLGSLCRHDNINIWAKFKPVIFPTIQNDEQLEDRDGTKKWKTNVQNPWWRGNNGLCGINFPVLGIGGVTIESMRQFINGGKNGWVHIKPNGGANSPFRISDFIQYNHEAKPAFEDVTIDTMGRGSEKYVFNNGGEKIGAFTNIRRNGTETELGISDIIGMSEYNKLTLVAVGGGKTYTSTSATSFDANGHIEVNLPVSTTWATGDYEVYPLLTDGINYTTIPYSTIHTVSVRADYLTIRVVLQHTSIKNWSYQIYVRTSRTQTFYDMQIKLRYGDKTYISDLETDEWSENISGTFVVSTTNETLIKSGTITRNAELLPDRGFRGGAVLWCRIVDSNNVEHISSSDVIKN